MAPLARSARWREEEEAASSSSSSSPTPLLLEGGDLAPSPLPDHRILSPFLFFLFLLYV
jgi:hypothetical protein